MIQETPFSDAIVIPFSSIQCLITTSPGVARFKKVKTPLTGFISPIKFPLTFLAK